MTSESVQPIRDQGVGNCILPPQNSQPIKTIVFSSQQQSL